MTKLFHNRSFYIALAAAIILTIVVMAFGVGNRSEEVLTTTSVDIGSVREIVSVSGIAKAKQTAELALPVSGIVETVYVNIGDEVQAGDALVSLNKNALEADRQEALAAIAKARADRDELVEGPTESAREVTTINVETQEIALQNAIDNENQKVQNAYRTLLSSGLTAYSQDSEEQAIAPIISGTYTCDDEGSYLIETFSSNSESGYSFRMSGLEKGTFVASVDQPGVLGNCGLRIQFNPNSSYNRTKWDIDIPNTKSPQYVANRNAYALALTQRESAITAAKKALTLSEANSTNQNAPARNESVTRANASIDQAIARLARINATIADRTLTAPFSGIVTEIDIVAGETVTTSPVVTLLADGAFELTARIPEIDIGKLAIGQKVEMLFDARPNEITESVISFISLKATEIDGVSYYEATIELTETPSWMRSGLNADIDIIVKEQTNVLRLPKRFITNSEADTVLILTGDNRPDFRTASKTIEIIMEGNDGYVALTGLNEGDIVVAP
jgi:RND family efflux transporter MFP subunit